MIPKKIEDKKIVVIGGGTGSYTVLKGLKKYSTNLTAIVSMVDDGGSTGRLRDELGVLPPGDIRQCLVALSDADLTLRKLFNYRFDNGDLKGHTFGNIFISAFEKMTGNLNKALEEIGNVLKIKGRVLPVTLNKIKLVVQLNNGTKLIGEDEINHSWFISKFGIKKIFLEPPAKANKEAIKAILDADIIVIGPGNLYCSIIPALLVKGIVKAIKKSKAIKIYNCNLMNKFGHTDGFSVEKYKTVIEKYLSKNVLNYVLYNTKKPSKSLLKKYASEGEPVIINKNLNPKKFIGKNLISPEIYKRDPYDQLKNTRSLIRHEPNKLAKAIISFLK